jgi:hypothetical protein
VSRLTPPGCQFSRGSKYEHRSTQFGLEVGVSTSLNSLQGVKRYTVIGAVDVIGGTQHALIAGKKASADLRQTRWPFPTNLRESQTLHKPRLTANRTIILRWTSRTNSNSLSLLFETAFHAGGATSLQNCLLKSRAPGGGAGSFMIWSNISLQVKNDH